MASLTSSRKSQVIRSVKTDRSGKLSALRGAHSKLKSEFRPSLGAQFDLRSLLGSLSGTPAPLLVRTDLSASPSPSVSALQPKMSISKLDARSLISSLKDVPHLEQSDEDDDFKASPLGLPGIMILKKLMGQQVLQLTTTIEFKVLTTVGGSVNQTFTTNSITGSTEWGAINQLFDEFFILRMRCKFFPLSRYQYLTASPPSTNFTNVPFASVSLFHSNTAYAASLAGPAENPTCRFGNTMERHDHTWVNNENWRSGANVASTTSLATPTQGWCNIAASPAGAYTGFVQICGSDAMAASSFQFGRMVVFFDALYRSRS